MRSTTTTTTGVTVKWTTAGQPENGYTFAIRVTDGINAKILFRIVGFRPTEIEARSACCDVLTMLNVSMGIPLADMVEVVG